MVLLHALHRLGWKNLVVCHLNHKLRGRTADADARFVLRQAVTLGFPCEVGIAHVRELAKRHKLSIETAARNARHDFFASCAAKYRCSRLLLAHHADDQAETVLMHLFRGAGLQGLSGMAFAAVVKMGQAGKKISVLRPLLDFSREAITDFAAAVRVSSREDASNNSCNHLRNRIRHQLLPLLTKTFGRNLQPVLRRLAEISRADDAFLQQCAGAFPLGRELSVRKLREQPLALQRRILRNWLLARQIPGICFEQIESIREVLRPGGPPRANLLHGRQVRRSGGWIRITDCQEIPP